MRLHLYIFNLGFFLTLFVFTAAGQRFGIDPEDAAIVAQLKSRYGSHPFVSLDRTTSFTFHSNGILGTVSAEMNTQESLIALEDGASFEKVAFYDSQSEISNVLGLYGKKGRSSDLPALHSDYSSSGIFHDDARICRFGINFKKYGDRFKYSYSKKFYDVKYLTSIYFHDYYPIDNQQIVFDVPAWLNVEFRQFNFEGFDIESTQKTLTASGGDKITRYVFTARHLSAYANEANAPRMAKDFPHIIVLCKSFEYEGITRALISSTDDLYAWYHKLSSEVDNKTADLEPLVSSLISNQMGDIGKIESIFYWVQDNIRYIAFEEGLAGFQPEACQDVYNNKYGDCKGMANLTKEMLLVAGFDARLTWLGTRDIPYDYSLPSLVVDNHMICTVIHNGHKYFLDPTEKFISFDDYAHRIQGRPVLIEDGSSYILDQVPEYGIDRNKVSTNISMSLEGEVLKGHIQKIIHGEHKTDILRAYSQTPGHEKKEALRSYLSLGDKNLKITNIEYSDFSERSLPLHIECDFELYHQITKIGNEYYININLEKKFHGFKIDSDRINDVEFPYKMLFETTVELLLPTGYKVDYVPDSVFLQKTDFSFNLNMRPGPDKIVYYKNLAIPNSQLKKEDFETWNLYIDELDSFYDDQIILISP